MVINKCIQCGKDYKVKPYRAKTQKYCDFDCYLEANQKKTVIRCPVCNKALFTSKSKPRKYCSRLCKRLGQIKLPMETPCKWCSKPVRRKITGSNRKYCNMNCYKEYLKYKKMQKYKKICECCMQAYYDTEGRHSKRRFCSKSCSSTKITTNAYLFKR